MDATSVAAFSSAPFAPVVRVVSGRVEMVTTQGVEAVRDWFRKL